MGLGGENMGLATQTEIDDAVIKAKQKLRDDEILDVLKRCSCGDNPIDCKVDATKIRGGYGKPVTMDLKGGDNFGKTKP